MELFFSGPVNEPFQRLPTVMDGEVSPGFSFEGRRVFSQDVLGGGWRLEWLAVGFFLLGLYTHPWKMNGCWNPKSWEFGWKMMFIFNWMIFRFQPVIFKEGLRDVTKVEIWHSWKKFWNMNYWWKENPKEIEDVIICPFFCLVGRREVFFSGEAPHNKISPMGWIGLTFRWDKFVPKRRRRTGGIYNRCCWLPCCV